MEVSKFSDEELGHIQFILGKADPTTAMAHTQGVYNKIQQHAQAQVEKQQALDDAVDGLEIPPKDEPKGLDHLEGEIVAPVLPPEGPDVTEPPEEPLDTEGIPEEPAAEI